MLLLMPTVKLVWPRTTSAEAPLAVGIVLKIRTRLLCVSATNSFPFCSQTPCGPLMDFADGGFDGVFVVKSGWPTTTSAGWLFWLGMVFQISTRLLSVSATTRRTPSEATAVGLRRPLRVGRRVGSVVVKSFWPRTTEAVPTQTGQRCVYNHSSVGPFRTLPTSL